MCSLHAHIGSDKHKRCLRWWADANYPISEWQRQYSDALASSADVRSHGGPLSIADVTLPEEVQAEVDRINAVQGVGKKFALGVIGCEEEEHWKSTWQALEARLRPFRPVLETDEFIPADEAYHRLCLAYAEMVTPPGERMSRCLHHVHV